MIRIEISTMVFFVLGFSGMAYVLWRHLRNIASSPEHASETLHRGYDKDGNFLGYLTEAGMDLITECEKQYEDV